MEVGGGLAPLRGVLGRGLNVHCPPGESVSTWSATCLPIYTVRTVAVVSSRQDTGGLGGDLSETSGRAVETVPTHSEEIQRTTGPRALPPHTSSASRHTLLTSGAGPTVLSGAGEDIEGVISEDETRGRHNIQDSVRPTVGVLIESV